MARRGKQPADSRFCVEMIQTRWGIDFIDRYIPEGATYACPSLYWPLDVLVALEDLSRLECTRTEANMVQHALEAHMQHGEKLLARHIERAHQKLYKLPEPFAQKAPDMAALPSVADQGPASADTSPSQPSSGSDTVAPVRQRANEESSSLSPVPVGVESPPSASRSRSTKTTENLLTFDGYHPDFGAFHGPYPPGPLCLAAGVSPICGYVYQDTGEQCGFTILRGRKSGGGIRPGMCKHLKDEHKVHVTSNGPALKESRQKPSEWKSRLLDPYYEREGLLDRAKFRNESHRENRNEVQRKHNAEVERVRPRSASTPTNVDAAYTQMPAAPTLNMLRTPVSMPPSFNTLGIPMPTPMSTPISTSFTANPKTMSSLDIPVPSTAIPGPTPSPSTAPLQVPTPIKAESSPIKDETPPLPSFEAAPPLPGQVPAGHKRGTASDTYGQDQAEKVRKKKQKLQEEIDELMMQQRLMEKEQEVMKKEQEVMKKKMELNSMREDGPNHGPDCACLLCRLSRQRRVALAQAAQAAMNGSIVNL